MKKKLLYSFLIFALAVILGASVLNAVEVNAASKPAMQKKKVTLYTNSEPYTIQINNLAKNATVTYKSSNKKIVTVSKKGVVTPVVAGKASVKATVKQNGKTYKICMSHPYDSNVIVCGTYDSRATCSMPVHIVLKFTTAYC